VKLSAQQVYNKLQSQNLTSFQGSIQFKFGGVDVNVCQKDVVGNIIQEWLQKWFDKEGIEYAVNENTQMPPDFFLDPDNKEHNMLEVKAFNYDSAPGFDIADFTMYATEIRDNPYMLDVDYLIFGYSMDSTGVVSIKDFWLKKVWEITRRGDAYPLFIQVKRDQIHKIRPAIWYRDDRSDFSPFLSIEDFVSAVEQTIHNASGKLSSDIKEVTWRSTFIKNYKKYYHTKLSIPRWDDIEDKYDLRIIRAKKKATEARDAAQRKLEKCKTRVSTWEDKLADAHTLKQKEKAEESLNKAKAALAKATFELTTKQSALDQLS
jgi:type II restriction enzyme